jgi:hypothetical protein
MLRFNAFDIFTTPVFFLASDFNSRTSDDVHARRVTVFFLVGIPSSLNVGTRFQRATLILQRVAFAALNQKQFLLYRHELRNKCNKCRHAIWRELWDSQSMALERRLMSRSNEEPQRPVCDYRGSWFSDGRKRVRTRYSSPRDQDSSVLPRMSTLIATKGSFVATIRA